MITLKDPTVSQTTNQCIISVMADYRELQYVNNQTDELCVMAINMSISAFNYIRNPSENVHFAMLNILCKKNWLMLIPKYQYIQYVKPQNILRLLALYPHCSDYLLQKTRSMIRYYDIYNNEAVTNIISATNKLLYRPNYIGGLLFGQCPKLLFLT